MATLEQQKNGIIKQSVTPEISPLNVINKLGQKKWVIVNTADNESKNLHFSTMNEYERLWVQRMLLEEFPFQDARNTLRYVHSTLLSRVNAIKPILTYLREQSVNKQQLKKWEMAELVNFIEKIALKKDTLMSNASVRPIVKVLKLSYDLRYEQDGLPFPLPVTLMQQVMTPLCEKFGLTYSQWEQGGTRDTVPIPVATLLLADAIKLIHSNKCKLLEYYFTSFRSGLLTIHMLSGGSKNIFKKNIADFIKPSKPNSRTGVIASPKNDKQRVNFVKKLHEISPDLTDFPFKSQGEINDFVQEIVGACVTILLAVTAMRISECHSVGADWMEAIPYLDINGVWTTDAILKSKIIKTGGGIVAKRGLSPLGVEVFELINTLSWVDKEKLGLKLFSPTYTGGWMKINTDLKKSSISIKYLRRRIKEYYQQFVERAHQSVRETFPDIVPHNLRHLKMAFGLRKFDGDPESALKQEFRHHNHHTQSYSRNRLNEEEAAIVRREYTQDIIKRILINDPSDKWAGPSAKKVRTLAEKLLDGLNIEMLSLEKLAEFHQEMDENIHSMLMHSYGMCFVLKDSVHLAKCGVKDSIVKTGSANSKLCHGCTNFCVNNKSHQHDLSLNKRRWTATANSKLIESFPIVAEAKAMVKSIEKLEAALEANDE